MTLTPEESLKKMWRAADAFYLDAIRTDCHAFIEFAGLMREYCKVCEHNLSKGIDFRDANAHTSKQMNIEPYQLNYLNEKLECIFKGLLRVEKVENCSSEQ